MPTLNVEKLRTLVTISLTCEPEIDGPEGFFATGDEQEDAATVLQILNDLEWNEWAWCVAVVRVSWGDFEVERSLGGCSYKSAEDFKTGGYYDDLVADALDEMAEDIMHAHSEILSLLD